MIHDPMFLWLGEDEFTKSHSYWSGWSESSEICVHEGSNEQENAEGIFSYIC